MNSELLHQYECERCGDTLYAERYEGIHSDGGKLCRECRLFYGMPVSEVSDE